ncbi:MAG: serine protease inhibitor ecotin [Methylococcales bacterium]|nr:serine protease inhibitor ecotin [Methylococcales bacterium]
MQPYAKILIICGFLLSCMPVFADSYGMKPYPPAEDGYKRMVIHLPALVDEDANKLELIIGKTIKADCNRHWFGGQLTEEVAKGWGFPYFILKSVTGPASTLMACPPDTKEQEAFVQVRGDSALLRYNSKLPVVVYVPVGFEVHYRIWTAGEESGAAQAE